MCVCVCVCVCVCDLRGELHTVYDSRYGNDTVRYSNTFSEGRVIFPAGQRDSFITNSPPPEKKMGFLFDVSGAE